MSQWQKGCLLVVCTALPLLIAATGGGLPARPRFSAVGVGTAAPASAGAVTATGDITTSGNVYVPQNLGIPYSFTGDTNTGIGNPSADVMTFYTGGNTRGSFNSSGQFNVQSAGNVAAPALAFEGDDSGIYHTANTILIAAGSTSAASFTSSGVTLNGTVTANSQSLPKRVLVYVDGTVSCLAKSNYISQGFTSCTRTSAGIYDVTFSIAFGSTTKPACQVTAGSSGHLGSAVSIGTGSVTVAIRNNDGSAADDEFSLTCEGL